MQKIVVKFNKLKDIENLKKIMRNVYASSSDHLPDIAKFHLGEKIFIPNQVDKAELHIIDFLHNSISWCDFVVETCLRFSRTSMSHYWTKM